jgi:hypothetical protein
VGDSTRGMHSLVCRFATGGLPLEHSLRAGNEAGAGLKEGTSTSGKDTIVRQAKAVGRHPSECHMSLVRPPGVDTSSN